MKPKIIKFPPNFTLGGAIAAEEVEGYGNCLKAKTEWDLFYALDPNSFYHGINNSFTNDMTNLYKNDVSMFKKIGLKSLRISISWSRIFPKKNEINAKGIKYYHDLLDELNAAQIDPYITLMHFDLPAYCFENKDDGWLNKNTIELFVKFANVVFREYAHKVKYIATFNEPIVALAGYNGSKARYPCILDLKKGYQVVYNQIIAHAKVVNLFKNKYSKTNTKIGIVINWNHCYPKDNLNFSKNDLIASENYNHLNNYIFLSPAILGYYESKTLKILKKFNWDFVIKKEDQIEIAKAKIDWIGINYYFPMRVEFSDDKSLAYKPYKWNQARINVFRGWEIYPQALLDISEIMLKKYHNLSWMIGENGMGVENEQRWRNLSTQIIDDDYRISFISEHLEYLLLAIKNQANCFGYHIWSPIDNWSWINGYKNRYGLIELNLNN